MKPIIVIARHRGGRDREQRSSEAVTGRVDLLAGNNRRNGIERSHHSERTVLVHAEIAIIRAGILPRNNEN